MQENFKSYMYSLLYLEPFFCLKFNNHVSITILVSVQLACKGYKLCRIISCTFHTISVLTIFLLILAFMIWKTSSPMPLTYFNHYTLFETGYFFIIFLSTCTSLFFQAISQEIVIENLSKKINSMIIAELFILLQC